MIPNMRSGNLHNLHSLKSRDTIPLDSRVPGAEALQLVRLMASQLCARCATRRCYLGGRESYFLGVPDGPLVNAPDAPDMTTFQPLRAGGTSYSALFVFPPFHTFRGKHP